MPEFIRLRRDLNRPVQMPPMPPGLFERALWQVRPANLHALMAEAYASGGGSVGSFEEWFFPLVEDAEFDPALLITLVDDAGQPVGLVQCWASGFVKDLVVRPDSRGRGVGNWLLCEAFRQLRTRGLPSADLKVWTDNAAARRLYARHGMVEVG